MNRETLWRLRRVFPLVLLCAVLNDCGGKATSTTVSAPPSAIASLRYNASGAPDASFGGGRGLVVTDFEASLNDYALAVALQLDGKIVVAGSSGSTTAPNTAQGLLAVLRYKPDGSLDSTFGIGGSARTAIGSNSAEAVAVALQTNGKIVVAGTILASNFAAVGVVLVRYNADGTLDTSFGAAGTGIVTAAIGSGSDTGAAALVLQPTDGKILVAGHALVGTQVNIVLLRYDTNGSLDPGFGNAGMVTTALSSDAMALAIGLQSDGKIVAAGTRGGFASPPMDAVLVRYNTNGMPDTSFGTAGTGVVTTDIGSSNNFANAVAVQLDDKIVVAGHAFVDFAADTSDIAVIRYNANGTLDSSFGAGGIVVTNLGGFDNAFSVALQPLDGKIIVSGNTGSAGIPRVAVLRYDSSGVLDPGFGTGGIVTTSAIGPSTIASGNAVVLQPDGSIVVAGYD